MTVGFKWTLWFCLFLLWLVVSVFLGGFVLSVKESLGINVFSGTGYHAFRSCLMREGQQALHEKLGVPAPEAPPK